jgi:hypothetical protein
MPVCTVHHRGDLVVDSDRHIPSVFGREGHGHGEGTGARDRRQLKEATLSRHSAPLPPVRHRSCHRARPSEGACVCWSGTWLGTFPTGPRISACRCQVRSGAANLPRPPGLSEPFDRELTCYSTRADDWPIELGGTRIAVAASVTKSPRCSRSDFVREGGEVVTGRRVRGQDRPKLRMHVREWRDESAGEPHNRLLALLPPAVRARLQPHLQPVSLRRKEVLFRAREPMARTARGLAMCALLAAGATPDLR